MRVQPRGEGEVEEEEEEEEEEECRVVTRGVRAPRAAKCFGNIYTTNNILPRDRIVGFYNPRK